MSFTNAVNNNLVHTQTQVAATTLVTFQIATDETAQRESMSPQQIYQQEMEKIWENVNQLPAGQDTVVLSQLWALGKTPINPTPGDFPALAAYGFIAEQKVEGQDIWNPTTPYLHDFWRIGIRVSNAYGFALH